MKVNMFRGWMAILLPLSVYLCAAHSIRRDSFTEAFTTLEGGEVIFTTASSPAQGRREGAHRSEGGEKGYTGVRENTGEGGVKGYTGVREE